MTGQSAGRAPGGTDTTDRRGFCQFCQEVPGPVSQFGEPIDRYSRAEAIADGVQMVLKLFEDALGKTGGVRLKVVGQPV